jgi:hypothetical protein
MSTELNFLEGDAPGLEETASAVAPPAEDNPSSFADTPAGRSAPVAPGHVPLSAMLDEREKRQSLERQVADLRQHLAPPPPLPLEEQVEARLYASNLSASRRFAEREHGREAVGAVHQWAVARCDADPFFNQQMRSSDDPYEAAIQAYNRERVVAEVSAGDLEAFRAWKAASAAAQGQVPFSPRSQPAARVPRSLANAPGNGAAGRSGVSVGEGSAYAGLFK